MTNPFIEGFLKIEEARKNSENIFNEAKKLTAAQKRELDKNNNDKIDAEDFEMLRNEEAEDIPQEHIDRAIKTINARIGKDHKNLEDMPDDLQTAAKKLAKNYMKEEVELDEVTRSLRPRQRPEGLGQARIPQTMFTQAPELVKRNIGAAMPPRQAPANQSNSQYPTADTPRPTQRPDRQSDTSETGGRSIVPATSGAGGIYGPRPDTTTERGVNAASRRPEAVERDERGLRTDLQPTSRPEAETSTTPAPTTTQRSTAFPYGRSQDTQTGGGTFSANPTSVEVPNRTSARPEAPRQSTVPGADLPASQGGPTGEELPVEAQPNPRPQDYNPAGDQRDGSRLGAADASPATTTSTSPSRPDNDSGAPRRYDASKISPGMRMGQPDADEIRAAQSALGITADGIAGPQTRQAIRDFQRRQGLQADGVMGDQTRMALRQFIRGQSRDAANNPNMMADSFSPAELEHINSILEAMPVAPTDSGDSPNPTPRKKAEGSRSKGSLAD